MNVPTCHKKKIRKEIKLIILKTMYKEGDTIESKNLDAHIEIQFRCLLAKYFNKLKIIILNGLLLLIAYFIDYKRSSSK